MTLAGFDHDQKKHMAQLEEHSVLDELQPLVSTSRRSFLRTAVAVGGAGILGAGLLSVGILGAPSAYAHRVANTASDPGSGNLVVAWNKQLLRIVQIAGSQPATVHPTRSFAI